MILINEEKKNSKKKRKGKMKQSCLWNKLTPSYLCHESIERKSHVAAKELKEDPAKSSMLIAYNNLDT